jgi:hypothetical protein
MAENARRRNFIAGRTLLGRTPPVPGRSTAAK